MWLRGAALTGGMVCAFVVSTPVTAAPPRQITVVGGLAERTFEARTAAGKATGKLEVLVRNDSSHYARPTVRLLSPYPGSEASGRAAVLAPGKIERVAVSLTGRSVEELNGRLILGLSGASPVRQQALPVAATAPKAAAAPTAPAVEPEEVTVHLTRLCPLGGLPLGHLWCGSARTPTVYVSAAAYQAIQSAPSRFASSSTGGTARIRLSTSGATADKDAKAGTVPVRVYVRSDSHSEYTASYVLDESAKQGGQLKIKVEAQVWWLYPLIVLVIGAMLGYLVRWFTGTYRDRHVLEARLKEARNMYEEGLKARSQGMYPLQRWFGGFSEKVPAIPKGNKQHDQSGFASAWTQAREARSSADIEAVDKLVDKLEEDVANWLQINTALNTLDVAFQQAVREKTVREDKIAAYQDTMDLLSARSVTPPKDAETTEKTVTAIRGQAEIVAAYEPARVAWEDVKHDTDRFDAYNPTTIYGGRGEPLERTDQVVRKLIAKLNEATVELRPYATTRTSRSKAQLVPPDTETVFPAAQASDLEPALIAGPPKPRDSDPNRMRRGITRRDGLVFAFTLIASAVAYLTTLYVGKNFGSASQYVQAFGIGFAGQTLVGVAAFPLSRSVFHVGEKPAGA